MFNKEAFRDYLQELAVRHRLNGEDRDRNTAQQHDSKVRESMTMTILGSIDSSQFNTPDDSESMPNRRMHPQTAAHFDEWLSQAQITRSDFDLTVADVGFSQAVTLVQARIAKAATPETTAKLTATGDPQPTPRTVDFIVEVPVAQKASSDRPLHRGMVIEWLRSIRANSLANLETLPEGQANTAQRGIHKGAVNTTELLLEHVDAGDLDYLTPEPEDTRTTVESPKETEPIAFSEPTPLDEAMRLVGQGTPGSGTGNRLPELPVTTLTTAYKQATSKIDDGQREAIELVRLQDKIARVIVIGADLIDQRYDATQRLANDMSTRHPQVTANPAPSATSGAWGMR